MRFNSEHKLVPLYDILCLYNQCIYSYQFISMNGLEWCNASTLPEDPESSVDRSTCVGKSAKPCAHRSCGEQDKSQSIS